MTATTVDEIDTRSTWQRQLERPFIIARKLDQLRTSRIDPDTGERVMCARSHWHLTARQAAAVRLGARRAWWKYGPASTPSAYQDGRGGATVIEARALDYANQHLTETRKCWADGGAGYLARHIRLRMQEKMAVAAGPQVDSNGNSAKVIPWGVWDDLERQFFHGEERMQIDMDGTPYAETVGHQARPGTTKHRELTPVLGFDERDLERARKGRRPRSWGGRAVRKVPAEVQRQLAEMFYPGPRRPSSSLDPSDPTGESVAHDVWLDEIASTLRSGMLPQRGTSEPRMLTYRGRPLEGGRLPNGTTLLEIALETLAAE